MHCRSIKCTLRVNATYTCNKEQEKENKLSEFYKNKHLQMIDLKQRSNSRSITISRTIEKAKQIEEERKQKYLDKEIKRDEKLKEQLINTNQNFRKQTQSVQKDYYRQAVKLASNKLEEEKRNTYLKMLESKESRFKKSKSRLDDDIKHKFETNSTTKQNRQDYLKKFQAQIEQEKEEKLRKLMLKGEYLDEIRRNRDEDNRLRSVIHVNNKFRLSNNKSEL